MHIATEKMFACTPCESAASPPTTRLAGREGGDLAVEINARADRVCCPHLRRTPKAETTTDGTGANGKWVSAALFERYATSPSGNGAHDAQIAVAIGSKVIIGVVHADLGQARAGRRKGWRRDGHGDSALNCVIGHCCFLFF